MKSTVSYQGARAVQIPTNFSAAQAASIASVVSARDKASAAQSTAATPAQALVAQLEKSESANPDRDAQGQGDGFGEHARKSKDSQDQNDALATHAAPEQPPATDTDPPPDLLDLVC